jgi:hypothetical protein
VITDAKLQLVRDQVLLADHMIHRAMMTLLPISQPDVFRWLGSAVGTLSEAALLLSNDPAEQWVPV